VEDGDVGQVDVGLGFAAEFREKVGVALFVELGFGAVIVGSGPADEVVVMITAAVVVRVVDIVD
jgi:hypothetical protein